MCGRPLDSHNKDLRFLLPDAVVAVPEDQRELSWGGDALLAARGVGHFVRVLLPVRLVGGFGMRFGTWIGVSEADATRAWLIWDDPAYADMELEGRLANVIPPWGLYGARVKARVRDPAELPYVFESSEEPVMRVLAGEWDHEDVFGAVANS